MSNTHVKSVVQILTTILANDPDFTNYAIKLNSNTVDFLNELLKNSPRELEKFQQLFMKIIEDDLINMDDVPEIFDLLKTLYKLAKKHKDIKVTVEDVINLTQFILNELANTGGLNQKKILQLSKLIESASDLLNMFGVDDKNVINLKKFIK